MYNQVIFYCAFGAGDIFESREFVKEWMKLVPAERYCYAHGKNPRILLDIPNLEYKEFTVHMDSMRAVWDDLNGNLYVNCWIGRDGKYVLPGIGCTVEKLYDMHNDMLAVYNLGRLSGKPIDYIPKIDYSKYNLDGCTDFLSSFNGVEKVFIDNGLVQSMQANNFEFIEIIETVARNNANKIFLTSHAFMTTCNNIFNTNSITGVSGFDLNEVSYLSLFCSTLIGRNSGPHVFTQNKDNCFDKTKKLVSFTHRPEGASFVVNTPVDIKKYWFSSDLPQNRIIEEIERVLQ